MPNPIRTNRKLTAEVARHQPAPTERQEQSLMSKRGSPEWGSEKSAGIASSLCEAGKPHPETLRRAASPLGAPEYRTFVTDPADGECLRISAVNTLCERVDALS